jgi:IMP dehydrogenase
MGKKARSKIRAFAAHPGPALTFDDVLLVPKYSDVRTRKDVNTRAWLTGKIELGIPIVSANMDVVTESSMAIAMARLGGIGIVHRFLSIEDEAAEVARVKRSESFVIEDPFTLGPENSLADARRILKEQGIGGIMVVDKSRKLLGMLTTRDIVLQDNPTAKIKTIMTKREDLVTAPRNVSIENAYDLLKRNRIEKLPLVDRAGRLNGLITSGDLIKSRQFPNASKDKRGRLLVGAAIGVKGDSVERAGALLDAGADVLVVDIAHGHSSNAIDTIKTVKKTYGNVQIIAGNVATGEGTEAMINAGADAVKVGVGSGSICITRLVAGFGVPQLTAIMEGALAARDSGIPIIADGGVKSPGDVVKAIAAGASTVMIGSLLAGTDESPGAIINKNGRRYKLTRGMASLTATMDRKKKEDGDTRSRDNVEEIMDGRTPEGVEGLADYRGRTEEVVMELVGGLRSGMSYCGARTVGELQDNSEFMTITNAGLKESHPHDIHEFE